MKLLLLQKMIYVPSHGGANKANRLLMERLVGQGHECQAIVPALGSHGPQSPGQLLDALEVRGITPIVHTSELCVFKYNGVEVHAVFSRTMTGCAENLIRKFNPDWVLVTSEDPGQTLLASALNGAPDRTIYIVHTPLQMPFGPACFLPSTVQTDLIRRAVGIITVSNYVKDYIDRWSGVDSTVLRFPAYGDGPHPEFGAFERGYVTIVNPCAYKGITIFLELATSFPDVQFAAVPTWGTTSADHRALLRLPNVTLLKPVDNIDQILAQTRILLMPSLWMEAFPLLPVEAMLRAIPVLASNVGGLPEAKLGVDYVLPVVPIEQYEMKFDEREFPVPIIRPQDIRPWRAALQEVLTEPVTYQRISQESRKAALKFVAGARVEAFEEFLIARGQGRLQPPIQADGAAMDTLSRKRQTLLELRAMRSRKNGSVDSAG